MRLLLLLLPLALSPAMLPAQHTDTAPSPTASARPGATSRRAPASDAGPLFVTPASTLHRPVKVIAYGDMRFTNPSETKASNPVVRKALVAQIAEEQPDALLISGDTPWRGLVEDYAEFRAETEAWRSQGLHVYPALGNHEFSKCDVAVCLERWWDAFAEMPQLRNRRWYSAQLGDAIYIIALDSDTSLLPGSNQRQWLEAQIAQLPKSVKFVLITMHHPPVADVQTIEHIDHNPRPNEISLADLLRRESLTSRARFVVIAGHTHNYERFLEDGVMYFVSGGGGASPYIVDRSAADLYQGKTFPNYHYLRFTLKGNTLQGEMVRAKNPGSPTTAWEVKDKLEIKAK
jgi:hypothetical protein